MKQQRISIINGVGISAEISENGQIYIPVKPICQAIGVDPEGQRQRIMRHYILNSVAFTLKATGTNGKGYEMTCLPLEFVYGWLFTIDANLVAEERRESVANYQRECYECLYHHFAGSLRKRVEENNAEIELLKSINAAISDEKEARIRRKKAEEALDKLRSERLDRNPTLFD